MSLRLLPTLAAFVVLARMPALPAFAAQAAADEQYRFLAGLVEKGLHDLAVKEAREFLRTHPEHAKAPLARYRLAGALWELGRHDEAAREYELLARSEDFEYRAECLFRAGQGAQTRGDEARAREAFAGVLAAGQDYLHAPAHFALGELHFRARRFTEAEGCYEELLRNSPKCAEAPLARRALAWCALERGEGAEAARRARSYIEHERDPVQRDELRLLLGEALLESDAQAALAAFRALETPAQEDARWRGEGFALAALGDHAGAARAFEELLALAPEGRFAREAALQAGIEHLRGGDARRAVQRLEAAARDGQPETLFWLAGALRRAGEPAAALASLERALRARPSADLASRIQVLRGDCLTEMGQGSAALSAYEASGSPLALHAGALAALNQGDAEGAARIAERGLDLAAEDDPAQQGLRVLLAEALFAAGRYEAAEGALAAARKSASDPLEVRRLDSRLAWCRYLCGDLPVARERFAALAAQAGDGPEIEEALALLVRIPAEAGEPQAARAPAQRYLERHPQGRFADQASLVLARTGPEEGARLRYEQWLARFPASPLRASVLLELAERDSAAGAHADAARLYSEVVAASPGTAEAAGAAYGLGWSAFEQRDFEGCARALAPLLADGSGDAGLRESARELTLWAQVEAGELEAAQATWRALVAARGDEKRRLDGARRLVAALKATRSFAAAESLLAECQRALASPALRAEVWIESVYLALEREDPTRAEAAFAKAERDGASPSSLAEASYHLGETRLAAGETERALALFERATAEQAAVHPRTAEALHRLGFVRLTRGELALASAAFGALLEHQPEHALATEARFLLGECAYRQRDFESAARHFEGARAAARGELAARVLFRAGLTLGELGRWNECEAALAELARSAPQFSNTAEAELWRGRALLAQEKTRAAQVALERTLALDQGELAAQARLALGQLCEREGRLDDALSEYLKVALLYAHEPSVAEAHFSAGRVLEAQGERAKASARYAELCAAHPSSALAARARERLRVLAVPRTGETPARTGEQ